MEQFKNTSGIQPCWLRVLVLPDKIEEKTAGGIYLPQDTQEKEELKQMWGTLIAHGGNAFDEFKGIIPQVGDRVLFGKYAGAMQVGKDGQRYRLVNGRDIIAVQEKE